MLSINLDRPSRTFDSGRDVISGLVEVSDDLREAVKEASVEVVVLLEGKSLRNRRRKFYVPS